MTRLLLAEVLMLGFCYSLSGFIVSGVVLAGRMSPLYARPASLYVRWWSWGALIVYLSFFIGAQA